MCKNTPGPWAVEQDGSWPPHIVSSNEGVVRVAHVYVLANAHLISAAPDLLEACRNDYLDIMHDELSELIEDPDAGNDDIRSATIDLLVALNMHHVQRKAAVAKALGEDGDKQ